MSKRPQLRKRASSTSSSDSGADDAPPPAAKRRPAAGASRHASAALSFAADDEIGSEDEFMVKKSKASRIIKKKMRQAPAPSSASGVETMGPVIRDVPSAAMVGGDYSAESLAALRSAQRFSSAAPAAALSSEGAMEAAALAGDDAALAEAALGGDAGETAADLALRQRLDRFKDERSTGDKKRVKFVNAIPRSDDRDFQDLDGPDAAHWEEELLKRAGRVNKPDASGAVVTQHVINSSIVSAKSEEITLKHSLSSLLGGIYKLEENVEANKHKLSKIQNDHQEAIKEYHELKHKVESMGETQEWMEDFRLYCSDVVGMLREKSETIEELTDAIFNILGAETKAAISDRLDYQERCLIGIREIGQLLSLGGYLPKTDLLTRPPGGENLGNGCTSREIHMGALAVSLSAGFEEDENHAAVVRHLGAGGVAPRPLRVENEKIKQLQCAAELLMSDVREDIASVSEILSKFSRLRKDHPSRYRSAFVSMSLPPLIGGLVKLDMISRPLPSDLVSLEERPWHEPLFRYSSEVVVDANISAHATPDSDDTVLLPKVVYGAVFPLLLTFVETAFDPVSDTASAVVATSISQLLDYDIPQEKSSLLFRQLLSKFNDAFESICFPSLRSTADESSYGFLLHQLGQVNICLQNLFLFKDLLAASAVTKMVWNRFAANWSGSIAGILSFLSASAQSNNADLNCLIGVYMCIRVILSVCKCLPGGQRMLDTLYSQKNMNNRDDAVVNATYFLQVRELVAALNPQYKAIGVVGADFVVSLARGACGLLGRLRSNISDAHKGGKWADSDVFGDISALISVVRKLSS